YFLFFSYRYYHAYHGARAAAPRAVLVPTAERDEAFGLAIFKPLLRGVRGVMYNSPEERAMIHAVSGNHEVPGLVVGVGPDVHDKVDALAAREQRYSLPESENLSLVALDAWALGKAVLVDGKCDVLKGQCIRSNAGLYSEGYGEFALAFHATVANRCLAAAL